MLKISHVQNIPVRNVPRSNIFLSNKKLPRKYSSSRYLANFISTPVVLFITETSNKSYRLKNTIQFIAKHFSDTVLR